MKRPAPPSGPKSLSLFDPHDQLRTDCFRMKRSELHNDTFGFRLKRSELHNEIQIQDSDFRFRIQIQISDSDSSFRFQIQISLARFEIVISHSYL